MFAVRVPAGWTPDWPAFPIDATHFLETPVPPLLGPKDCETYGCEGGLIWDALDILSDPCPDCSNGKVPQRVALVTGRTCEGCRGRGRWESLRGLRPFRCPDCAGSGVRLVATHTATVQAVMPIGLMGRFDTSVRPAVLRENAAEGLSIDWGTGRIDIGSLLPLADWSPGRWAVLTSDVQPVSWIPAAVRPFTGPIALLSEVLA